MTIMTMMPSLYMYRVENPFHSDYQTILTVRLTENEGALLARVAQCHNMGMFSSAVIIMAYGM